MTSNVNPTPLDINKSAVIFRKAAVSDWEDPLVP